LKEVQHVFCRLFKVSFAGETWEREFLREKINF
jgi:hypothetical protein